MIVVIEGPDLSGKSTLAKELAQELGYKYIKWPYEKHILEKCPDESGETFYKTLLQFKEESMVIDRGFVSNFVYCDFMGRQYNNDYIHDIVRSLKPLIIHLDPTDEVLSDRMDKRSEDFIRKDDIYDLRDCYNTHVVNLREEHEWDIVTVKVDKGRALDKILGFVNQRTSIEEIKRDVRMHGSLIDVFSNYHKQIKRSFEKMFNFAEFRPLYHIPVYDKDYEDILPRVDEVVELLKQEPSHRGAVILNKKAESGDCVCLWHFLIRKGRLYSFVYIRSSDVERKMRQDFEMTTWLIKTIADKVGISKLGKCVVVQGSAHYYM